MILFLFLFLLSCSQLLICPFFPFGGTLKLMRGTKCRYELQPHLQRDIVNDYRRDVRGHGYLTIAKKHQLPIQTVRSVIARAERAGGDLDSAEQARLYSSLDRNPFTTNQQFEGSCQATKSQRAQ